MPGSIPFTKKCDAYQRMVELLEDGTIGPDMAPRDAYRTDPVFLQYSEVAFKSQLKKWKDANGMAGRPPKRVKEPSYCHRKCKEKELIVLISCDSVTNLIFAFTRVGIWYSWRINPGKCHDRSWVAEVDQLDPTMEFIEFKDQWSPVYELQGKTRA